MEALASISQFMDIYSRWKEIKDRYQLRWNDGDGYDPLKTMLDSKHNYSSLMK
jgi:hypothetical protein